MKIRISILIIMMTIQFGRAQEVSIAADLKQKVENASMDLVLDNPNHMEPLAFNATLLWSDDKSQVAVIIKANLMNQWHIYAYVPETQPYITSSLKMKLPHGISAIGEWEKPFSVPYEEGIYIYEETLIFVRYCAVNQYNEGDEVFCGLYYQACDAYKCFPPKTKSKTIPL